MNYLCREVLRDHAFRAAMKADPAKAYIDVTAHSTPDNTPLGSMYRARWAGEVASTEARMRTDANRRPQLQATKTVGALDQDSDTSEKIFQSNGRTRAAG